MALLLQLQEGVARGLVELGGEKVEVEAVAEARQVVVALGLPGAVVCGVRGVVKRSNPIDWYAGMSYSTKKRTDSAARYARTQARTVAGGRLELALLVLEEAEELRGGGAGLDLAEVDVAQREARQRLKSVQGGWSDGGGECTHAD